MSFDKHYPNRKDRRSQYYDSRACDRTCRSHGDCPHCEAGRKHKHEKHTSYLKDHE